MVFFRVLIILCLVAPSGVAAQPITEDDLRQHIEILASDDFGGRKPGTEGENKTVNYIAEQWANAGLVPAGEASSWYAPVNLIERVPIEQSQKLVSYDGERQRKIRIRDRDLILRGANQFGDLSNAQLVYVGYGNGSPETLERAVSGKLAVMLLSQPENDDDFPDYRARKEALIAAGAWGVLTVIEGERRFANTARRYRRSGTTVADPRYHSGVEGMLSQKTARKILDKAGFDARKILADSRDPAFKPLELPIYADLKVETKIREYVSHNVVGKIPGKLPGTGAVMFMGHWDHLGECRTADEQGLKRDRICNGAVDNASGIALLIETAERLTDAELDRDIYFLGTTAEEMGLLGARAFAENPTFPLEQLVAVFNADTIALAPNGKKIAVVGLGKTALDPQLEALTEQENREIDRSDNPQRFVKRQDGFVFLEKGIPAFMITSAFADEQRLEAYIADRYHDVHDELDDGLLLGGATDDANFHVALGKFFGSTEEYPEKATSGGAQN